MAADHAQRIPMNLSTPRLEPIMQLTVHVAQPVDAGQVIHALGEGCRCIIPITGGRIGSPADIASLVRGESVPPERIYFRCAPRFEVERKDLAWMTQALFIGTGARFPDRVEMVFCEVM
jgi:hypothetical protein